MEFGHWELAVLDGVSERVWVPHCVRHPGFAQPCRVCEALPLGTDEGGE